MEVTPKFDLDSKSDSDEDDNIKQFGPTSTKIIASKKQHVDDIDIIIKPWFDRLEVTSGPDHKANITMTLYHEQNAWAINKGYTLYFFYAIEKWKEITLKKDMEL
ncbi:hypothetical protein NC652_019140 [Populus alba x Populus x berolinensis]|nr:hypothetical protein NC652_019140 [Populus alba x Populus x berolinensis]